MLTWNTSLKLQLDTEDIPMRIFLERKQVSIPLHFLSKTKRKRNMLYYQKVRTKSLVELEVLDFGIDQNIEKTFKIFYVLFTRK